MLKPDLEALRTLVAVADAGGLTAATGRLGRTTSALSRRLSQLESQVGAALFDRTTKQFRLTRAGEALVECGRRVLEDVDATIGLIGRQKEDARRRIVVSAFDSMAVNILPRAIQSFSRQSPQTTIQIKEMNSASVMGDVDRQGADIGIAVKGAMPPSLAFRPLLRDPFVLACPKSSKFAGRKAVTWTELGAERLIGFSPGTINRAILDRALLSKNIKMVWTYQVQQIASAIALLEQKLGMLVFTSTAVPSIAGNESVVVLDIRGPTVAREIGVIRRNQDAADDHIDRFEECIRDAAVSTFAGRASGPGEPERRR